MEAQGGREPGPKQQRQGRESEEREGSSNQVEGSEAAEPDGAGEGSANQGGVAGDAAERAAGDTEANSDSAETETEPESEGPGADQQEEVQPEDAATADAAAVTARAEKAEGAEGAQDVKDVQGVTAGAVTASQQLGVIGVRVYLLEQARLVDIPLPLQYSSTGSAGADSTDVTVLPPFLRLTRSPCVYRFQERKQSRLVGVSGCGSSLLRFHQVLWV